MKKALNWVRLNWERVLFAAAGIALGAFGFWYLYRANITGGATAFALSFFSFLYSNLARFKRFKGFGLEAELWEDKQKEAADLIDRLKGIVQLYSQELVLSKAKAGRWGVSGRWKEVWALFDEIRTQHDDLGQKIDFSSTKRTLDTYFLFDIIQQRRSEIIVAARKGIEKSSGVISSEFGNPVADSKGYSARLAELHSIDRFTQEPFELATERRLATETLALAIRAQTELKTKFGVEVEYSSEIITFLERFSILEKSDALEVTSELIDMADK
jgi:hypothetical protein